MSREPARRYIAACILAHAAHCTRVRSDVYQWLEGIVRERLDTLVRDQRRFKSLRAPALTPEQQAACLPRSRRRS